MRALALLGIVVTLAGCVAPGVSPTTTPPLPSAADLPRPELLPLSFDAPVLLEPIGGTEPNVRADAQDRIFVTTTGTNLWRSLDGGASFEAMGEAICNAAPPASLLPGCPTGADRDSGLEGGGDGALVLDGQGRLHWAGLFGPNASVPYQFSDDQGATWSDAFDLADGNSTDREWLAVAPNGTTIYALWRDSGAPQQGGGLLAPATPTPVGLRFRASHDRGLTWGPIVAVEDEDPVDGPLAVDPVSGALYVAVSYFDGRPVTVLRSFDAGATWDAVPLPAATGQPAFGGIMHFIFPLVAVDAAGTVYAAWSEDPEAAPQLWTLGGKSVMTPKVFLSVSKDRGATWSAAMRMSPPDRAAVLPALVAGAPGRVALGWYEAATPLPSDVLPNEWFVRLATTVTADQAEPAWEIASTTSEPIHFGSICTQGTGCTVGDRTRGDFFEIALRPNGLPIVGYVQDSIPPNESQRRTQVVVARVAEGTPLLAVAG
ncbi:MAG TPA: sialidase family protein [Candidatus Thermoplasmatota archaeon]|jgi:hypothetical protein|nr:sialidase family protein [Candidatus Thermoplasmatota archaeon]